MTEMLGAVMLSLVARAAKLMLSKFTTSGQLVAPSATWHRLNKLTIW
jgi:hypothetical protein